MSDFLSKFSGNNYDELLQEDREQKRLGQESEPSKTSGHPKKAVLEEKGSADRAQIPRQVSEAKQAKIDRFFNDVEDQDSEEFERSTRRRQGKRESSSSRRDDFHEEIEVDLSYQSKQKRKRLWIALATALTLVLGYVLFYQFTHVSVPNFVGKTVTEVREWGNEQGVEIVLEQAHNVQYDANVVISQKIAAGKKVAKGGKLDIVGSLGADPEERLELPDFSTLSYSDAQKWIDKHKAENIHLKQEYSDTVAKGKFIKLDIANSVPSSDYTRGDKATLTYSRGKEVLEANIEVPDFSGKTKADVESWAKSNGVEVIFEEKANATIAQGTVLSQSVAAKERIAKKSKMTVAVSAGKGVTVPDFSTMTMAQAGTVSGLSVIVRQTYGDVPYGALISQSQKAGTELTEKDDRNVEVVYSAGSPYLRDLTGKNEGELQQYFYDEFRSKGAEIYFTSYYVNSDQPKGTVVAQSAKETWLPLNYTVEVGVSNGAYFTGTVVPPVTDNAAPQETETTKAP